MAAQIYTLVGVAVGAIASYSVSALNERARYKRELRRGWAEKRLEIYGDFLASIKEFNAITRMLAAGAGLLTLDHQQASGGQRPRQPDPVAAAALDTDRHPRPGSHLRNGGQHSREPRAVVANLHRRDRLASRISELHLMAVAVGIDPDDGIYYLCQHGHAACLLPGCGRRRTGLGGVTGWHICDGSRQLADRLLIRSTRWARPGPATPGTGQMKGTPNRGQIRSESPGITGTDPGGSPPRTAGNDTHRSVARGGAVAEGLRAVGGGYSGRLGSAGCVLAAARGGLPQLCSTLCGRNPANLSGLPRTSQRVGRRQGANGDRPPGHRIGQTAGQTALPDPLQRLKLDVAPRSE
jgi:hypothetical protein